MKHHLLRIGILLLSLGLTYCKHPIEDLHPEVPDNPITPADPYDALVGVYQGLQSCNGSGLTAVVNVSKLSNKTGYLKIGADEVRIDTTCTCFPDPSISGYRFYHATFRNDSLLLYTETGTLHDPYQCHYYLKKQ